MTETEVKILEVDKAEIEQNILAAGGKKIFEGKLLSQSFDNLNGDIENNKRTLRLRQTPKEVFLTYKEDKKEINGLQVAQEYEILVSNAETAAIILKKLGYSEITKVREKMRTSYKLDSVRIEIDEYPNIPAYIEIEGEESAIHEALKTLGYTMDDTTNMTASEVLKKYGCNPDYQIFKP